MTHPVASNPEDPAKLAASAPLLAHLAELRYRLLITCGFLVLALGVAAWHAQSLIEWLIRPLTEVRPGLKLAALGVTEGFMTTLRVSLYAAIAATLPVATWQTWVFVRPGLLPHERGLARWLLPPMAVSFVAGAWLAYAVMIPLALRFLIGFMADNFTPVFSFEAYVSFVATVVLATGLLFELPFVLLFLDWVGLVSVEKVAGYRRHAIVVIFVIAAVFTPPDPFSQVLLAVPLVLLFEGGIWLSRACRRFGPAAHRRAEDGGTVGPAAG